MWPARSDVVIRIKHVEVNLEQILSHGLKIVFLAPQIDVVESALQGTVPPKLRIIEA